MSGIDFSKSLISSVTVTDMAGSSWLPGRGTQWREKEPSLRGAESPFISAHAIFALFMT